MRCVKDRAEASSMFDNAEVNCPYPGLRPFEPYEAEIFFGREGHTDQLLEILQRERFLAVIGPSGGGKSSLVRAGLLPALAGGRLGTGSHWRLALLRPGSQPMLSLAQALIGRHALGSELLSQAPEQPTGAPTPMAPATTEQATSDAALIASALRSGADGFERVLQQVQWRRYAVRASVEAAQASPSLPTLNLLILVDQFEELFTYRSAATDPDEAAQFVQLLLRACGGQQRPKAEPTPGSIRVVVALTMRSEFLGQCVDHPDLAEAINRATFLTPRLRPHELEAAIADPAEGFGGKVDVSFAKATIASSDGGASDQLPLLQHALARWWRAAEGAGNGKPVIGSALALQEGSLHEALNLHAERLYTQMSDAVKLGCEALFRAITTGMPDGTAVRRPQRLADISKWSGVPESTLVDVVKALSAPEVSFLHHGLTLASDSTIDVTHEALMRHWIRLKKWVASEKIYSEEWQRWHARAGEYANRQGELLVGRDLARALEWWNPSATNSKVSAWAPTSSWVARHAAPHVTEPELEEQLLQLRGYLIDSDKASSRAQEKRKRVNWILSALLMIALVALALVVWISILALDAEKQKVSTAKEAAVGGAIAAAETQLRQGNPDVAAFLGINALMTLPDSAPARSGLLLALDDLSTRFALTGHGGPVRFVADSASGTKLITTADDGTVLFWRASDGKQIGSALKRTASVVGANVSSDGNTLLVGYADGVLIFWDVGAMRSRREIHTESQLGGVSLSADGRVAIAWDASSGKVNVWSRDDESRGPTEVDAGTRPINDAVLLANGNLVATAHQDGLVRLWDAARGTPIRSLAGHQGSVRRLYESPDKKTLLSTSSDHTARTWNIQNGFQSCLFPGNKGAVTAAAFSPDGKRVATVGTDSTARVWSVVGCKQSVDLRGHRGAINSVAFSNDGRRIVTAGDDFSAKVWHADHGTLVSDLKGHIKAVRVATFSGASQDVLTGSDDGSARLWSVEKGDALARLDGFRERVLGLARQGSDEQIVAILGDGRLRKWSRDGRGADWASPVYALQAAALSNDASTAAAVARVKGGVGAATLVVWSAEEGSLLHTHRLDPSRSYSVSANDDGTSFAISSMDRKVRVLTHRGATLVSHPVKTDGVVTAVSISGKGNRIAATLSDHAVAIIDATTGREICTLQDQKWPFSISHLNRDGSIAVTAGTDGAAVVWSVGGSGDQPCQPLGALYQTWTGGRLTITSLRLDPSGALLAVGNNDGSIKIWNMKSLTQVAEIKGHQSPIVSMQFAADGSSLYSVGSERSVRQWSLQRAQAAPDVLVEFAQDRLQKLHFRASRSDCKRYSEVYFKPGSDFFCTGAR
jgi:WD40 repeat protein